MIFLSCMREELVQVGDKTRIDVSKSFFNGDAITDIRIKPEASESFLSVFNANPAKWYLDWAYSTDGVKNISVEATDGLSTVSQDFQIEIISAADDNLYSSDAQLFSIESELRKYIPQERSSFNHIHREAQQRILAYLDRKRIWKDNGDAYSKDEINITGELAKWSLYEAAYLIYMDLYIQNGDKFREKMNDYKELRNYERDRGAIKVDKDGSGTIENNSEIQDLKSFRLIRR